MGQWGYPPGQNRGTERGAEGRRQDRFRCRASLQVHVKRSYATILAMHNFPRSIRKGRAEIRLDSVDGSEVSEHRPLTASWTTVLSYCVSGHTGRYITTCTERSMLCCQPVSPQIPPSAIEPRTRARSSICWSLAAWSLLPQFHFRGCGVQQGRVRGPTPKRGMEGGQTKGTVEIGECGCMHLK